MINKSFIGNAQVLKQLDVTENALKENTKIVISEKGITPQILFGDIPVKGKR